MLGYQRLFCKTHGISGLQLGKICATKFPPIGAASGSPGETGISGSKDVWPNRNNNLWMVSRIGHHILTGSKEPKYYNTLELANTFAATQKPLPAYGGLG